MKKRTSFRRSYTNLNNTYRFLSCLFLFLCYAERVMKRAVFFADVSLTLKNDSLWATREEQVQKATRLTKRPILLEKVIFS